MMEQVKFACSSLVKALEKQTGKQVDALKSPNPSNKKDELKQIERVFPQNLMNDLICAKFKKIVNLQDIIKTDEMSNIIYQNVEKFINLVNILCFLFFKKYTPRIFIIKRC